MRKNLFVLDSVKWIPKGWGGEQIICNNELYCGKVLRMMKGYRCSIHYHLKKTETFWLQSGKLIVYYQDDEDKIKFIQHRSEKLLYNEFYFEDYMERLVLNPGDVFHIPRGRVHQMVAEKDSKLFEFSTTDDPKDSYRIVKGD
jgi:mannose-6-phosphate isomerase-like protein (cupin superfamily)